MSLSPTNMEVERICFNFYSPLFLGVAVYDNQFETKEIF